MRLTPEQQKQVRDAKAAGLSRVTVDFTAEQERSWREAAAEAQAHKGETIAHVRKIKSAAQEPGFFGDIRRAILVSHLSPIELAANIGVDPAVLSNFRAGDAELPAAALSRLIEVLGLRLMQEIPH